MEGKAMRTFRKIAAALAFATVATVGAGASAQLAECYHDLGGNAVNFTTSCTWTLDGTAVTATGAELNTSAGVTCGTVTASKAVCVDANKDIATFRDVTGRTYSADRDDTTDGILNNLTMSHSSSDNNATVGDGVGISFELENATGTSTVEEWAAIDAVSTTITNGSEDGDVVVRTMGGGTVVPAITADASDQSLTIGANSTDADGFSKLRIFPVTASKGSLTITSIAQTGDTVVDIRPAAMGQATTFTIQDPGAAAANVDVVIQTDADITSAELLALNATPITLLAAPGAGKFWFLHRICCQVDYNSAAYAGIAANEDIAIRFTDGSGDIMTTLETTGWLDQTADTVTCGVPDDDFIPVANAAVVAHMTTDEIITGDSPLDCRLWASEELAELP